MRRFVWRAAALALCLAGCGDWSEGPTAPEETFDGVTVAVGAADGGSIHVLLGVNAGPYPAGEAGNADVTSSYKGIGVNLVRTHDFYGPLDMAERWPSAHIRCGLFCSCRDGLTGVRVRSAKRRPAPSVSERKGA